MIQIQIIEALQANYTLLHQIHLHVHTIKQQQYQRKKDKWSEEEDQLMSIAIQLYGYNIDAISLIVVSKSYAQVYQRLRYLRERSAKKFNLYRL
ncbi:Homeobox-like_domain superfamily [Hexamita inflata]|uniref:Homeobox-like domain superfamily n=1 Tax=Hexamita inflata TaxID=28002 RepID=A0AA86NHW9_9EUKA|nr:Homeobox-like domain superfamily [Hexamita inflata]